MPTSTSEAIKATLVADAQVLGFDVCRVTSAKGDSQWGERLRSALAEGHHGSMEWLDETANRRADPQAMWAEARSAIMLGFNYGPDGDPLAALQAELAQTTNGMISVYARNRDYHDIIKGKLKTLASKFVAQARKRASTLTGDIDVKVFVDTAPLMEKPLAARAGLGWQGKHTNLVSREHGSYLFLGSILTTLNLPSDAPETDHCGTCQACLDICPTNAFPSPYRLDARRCISYLTIEHDGPIDRVLRPAMGNRIYGCDDCLAACPWNKFASAAHEAKLQARDDLILPPLAELALLDDASFRSRFSGSPIKRIGRNRFVRNVLIAIGNSGDAVLAKTAEALTGDADPTVRGAAVWALGRLLTAEQLEVLQQQVAETDETVLAEWRAGGETRS
ncbi:MAG: tRNA epoxyqueuosine(34) reductase QueG [Pseudomonadota bacterium]